MKEVVACEEQSDETKEQDSQYANVFAKIFGEEPKEKIWWEIMIRRICWWGVS